MITGQGDERVAVEAMKLGAWDYLVRSGDVFTLLPGAIEKVVRERKLKEALERSGRTFKKIFEQSPIGIGLYDANGLLVNANKSYLQIFGMSGFVRGKGFKIFDDPNLSPELKEKLHRGETARYETPFDFEKVNKSELYEIARSGTAYFDCVTTPIRHGMDNHVSGYLVQLQDITERKRAEQEKKELQVHRMEAISTLAGGIAYDFNSALLGITGNIALLKMDLPNKESINRYLEAMHRSARRMAHLTN